MKDKKIVQKVKKSRFMPAIDFGKIFLGTFSENQVSSIGAESAYYFFFSLFPLLIFLISILPLFNIDTDALLTVLSQLPDQLYKPISILVDQVFKELDTTTLALSLILSIWSSSKAVSFLVTKVNLMYHAEPTRNSLVFRGISMLLTIGFVVSTVFTVFVFSFDKVIYRFFPYESVELLFTLLKYLTAPALLCLIFATLYYFSTGKKQKFLKVLPGAIFATAAFIIFTVGFFSFMPIVAKSYLKYGSLASVMILLLWFYSIGMIIALGPVFNLTLIEWRKKYPKRRFRKQQ